MINSVHIHVVKKEDKFVGYIVIMKFIRKKLLGDIALEVLNLNVKENVIKNDVSFLN